MTSTSQEDIGNAAAVVFAMHEATVTGAHAPAARHAAASLCSGAGHGFLYAPPELQGLITEAIEVGYAAALRDVHDGEFDEVLQQWRPALFEE